MFVSGLTCFQPDTNIKEHEAKEEDEFQIQKIASVPIVLFYCSGIWGLLDAVG